MNLMHECYYDKMVQDACQPPCHKVIYKAKKQHVTLVLPKENMFSFWVKFDTMNIEKYDEVWIMESYNFIGTVGGSLGLFIGFSYTGFFGQILDYLFSRNI